MKEKNRIFFRKKIEKKINKLLYGFKKKTTTPTTKIMISFVTETATKYASNGFIAICSVFKALW